MVLIRKIRWAGTLAWVSALALFGCLPEASVQASPQKPNQAEAMKVVWVDIYGMSMDVAPPVVWREGPELNCPWDHGKSWAYQDTCIYGIALSAHVEVAWPDGGDLYWRLSFAHELCHFRQYLLTGDGDPEHKGLCFNGENLAVTAQVALMSMGL